MLGTTPSAKMNAMALVKSSAEHIFSYGSIYFFTRSKSSPAFMATLFFSCATVSSALGMTSPVYWEYLDRMSSGGRSMSSMSATSSRMPL
ncbi:hypothetical protein HRbin01_01867 [archaeon HR01]|nr:hypothetical protein HRbin01_01867 [archaeon HR01]